MKIVVKKEYHGIQVAFEGKEKISLTDFWKASKRGNECRPAQWFNEAHNAEFVLTVIKNSDIPANFKCSGEAHLRNKPFGKEANRDMEKWCRQSTDLAIQAGLVKTTRGKGGGTWAHWQIALAYAKYLSPELHMWANQVVKDRIDEENNPDLALDRGYDRAVRGYKKHGKDDKWIENRLYSKIATKENNKVLAKHGSDNRVYRMCANALNVPIIGMTSQEYKESNKLPKSASIRDHFTSIQLLEIALASEVSKQRIKEDGIYGNQNCANVHSVIGGRVHSAVTMRGI